MERSIAKEKVPQLKAHFERVDKTWQGNMVWPTEISIIDLTREGSYFKNGIDAEDYFKGDE
jgi:hypothetical protein